MLHGQNSMQVPHPRVERKVPRKCVKAHCRALGGGRQDHREFQNNAPSKLFKVLPSQTTAEIPQNTAEIPQNTAEIPQNNFYNDALMLAALRYKKHKRYLVSTQNKFPQDTTFHTTIREQQPQH
jgi:hypothetical protein